MDQNHITTLTRSLTNRPSRRDIMRALLGTGFGLGALWLPDAVEAKKHKKRKKRKAQTAQTTPRNGQTCPIGQQVGAVSVPASGATANTPILAQGQAYRLRASGYWITNAAYGNDAFAAFPFANPNSPETTYQNVRLGLSVDGGSPDQWGSYTTTHVYERQVIGQGASLALRFTDPAPQDNSGSLLVDIFCA